MGSQLEPSNDRRFCHSRYELCHLQTTPQRRVVVAVLQTRATTRRIVRVKAGRLAGERYLGMLFVHSMRIRAIFALLA